MSNITEQLKELKDIKPSQDWVDAQRELLMSQIQVQSTKKRQSFVLNAWFFLKSLMPSGLLRFVARPVGVFTVMVVFVVSSGMLGVNASRLSLPGDFLYPVKLTTEKVKVSLTAGEENKAEKRLGFAEERVKEIEAVAAKEINSEEKKKSIAIAADALKESLVDVQADLDKAKTKPQQSKEEETIIVQVAQSLDKKAEDISLKLTQQKEGLDKDLAQVLDDVSVEAENTSVKAVEVIIDRVEKVEIDISQKELVEAIEKKIENTAKKVQEVKEVLETVEDQQEEISSDVEDSDEESENVVEDGDEESEESADEEVEDVTETEEDSNIKVTVEAEEALEEARDLLNQGDLTSALEIVKQTVEITQEVKSSVEIVVESTTPDEVSEEDTSEEVVDSDDSTEENSSEVESDDSQSN